jgi:uncharacterized protein YcfJ
MSEESLGPVIGAILIGLVGLWFFGIVGGIVGAILGAIGGAFIGERLIGSVR